MPAKYITLEDIEALREIRPRRRRFSDDAIVYQRADGRYTVKTLFPSIDRLVQSDIDIPTVNGPYGPYQLLTEASEISMALEWQNTHNDIIFLRDMLDCSVALDYNLASAGVYTNLGLAEHKAKHDGHRPSVNVLARACIKLIATVTCYQRSDVICAVPPSPDKQWDLPQGNRSACC